MRCFILAGGLGSRLRSVLADRPKCMAPVGGRPFLEYQLERLCRHGLPEITLLLGHLGDRVESHFGDGRAYGVKLNYVYERELQGTAGAIRDGAAGCAEPFLVLNGDTYLEVNYGNLLRRHRAGGAWATLALAWVRSAGRFGGVTLGTAGRIAGFQEKRPGAGPGWINGGVYILDPSAPEVIEPGRPVSFEREILPAWVAAGRRILGCRARGRFIDIGTPEDYRRAQDAELGGWI